MEEVVSKDEITSKPWANFDQQFLRICSSSPTLTGGFGLRNLHKEIGLLYPGCGCPLLLLNLAPLPVIWASIAQLCSVPGGSWVSSVLTVELRLTVEVVPHLPRMEALGCGSVWVRCGHCNNSLLMAGSIPQPPMELQVIGASSPTDTNGPIRGPGTECISHGSEFCEGDLV